jgi:hypothetical protein
MVVNWFSYYRRQERFRLLKQTFEEAILLQFYGIHLVKIFKNLPGQSYLYAIFKINYYLKKIWALFVYKNKQAIL